MVRVKICGITRPDDATGAVELGVDLIGLNFWPPSKRYVEPGRARELADAVRGQVETVGVFVDAEPDAIREIVETIGLDWVQLHGTESAEVVTDLTGLRIIQAFGIRDAASVDAVAAHLTRCRDLGGEPDVVLFDTHAAGQPGGTGRAFRWDLLQGRDWPHPVLLAGGLNPDNVVEAVRTVRPWGVDVAGGVESAPGLKDVEKMAAFVRAARSKNNTPKGVDA